MKLAKINQFIPKNIKPHTSPILYDIKAKSNTSDETYKNVNKAITSITLGGFLYRAFAINPRLGDAQNQQFGGEIHFEEAKTVQEAVNFGKQNLGIGEYIGFSEDDINTINWINEGLINIKNRGRNKVVMPKKIELADDVLDSYAEMTYSGELRVSKLAIEEARDFAATIQEATLKVSEDEAIEIMKNKSAKEIYKIIGDFVKQYPEFQKTLKNYQSQFAPIYHEMGHWQHFNNVHFHTTYAFITGIGESTQDKKLLDLFNNSEITKQKVTPYAAESPDEFVAECFSMLMDGVIFDKDVIDLYKKLGGVVI